MKYFEEKDSLFLAIACTMFTFAFMLLGVKLSAWYFLLGFCFLASSLVFWKKVEKIQKSGHKNLNRLFEEYNQKNSK